MARKLFVDTNVLLGLTFYSDRWFQEARPILDNNHEIHVSDLVVYEYCCSDQRFRDPPVDPEQLDIDWSKNQGLVGHIRNRLSKPYRNYRSTIRHTPASELTLEKAIDEFINAFVIREQAEPQIRGEFEREFKGKAVTSQYINEFASELIDKILQATLVMKEILSVRSTMHSSTYHIADDIRRKWKDFPTNPPAEPDLSIVIDATNIIEENQVDTILSGDSDILSLQKIANEYFHFDILSMQDEYSTSA